MDKVLRFKKLRINTAAICFGDAIDFIRGEQITEKLHIPPTGVCIQGKENLQLLRDALLEMVPLSEGSSTAPLMKELVSRREEYEASLKERDFLERALKILEQEKETWNRQVLSMEGNHQTLVDNLQTMIDSLKEENDEIKGEVSRIRKNKNFIIENLQAENILLKNELIEKQRTPESLRGQLAEANQDPGGFSARRLGRCARPHRGRCAAR